MARDGIEPPTPAFSGPRSTTELSGLGESKDAASAYVVSESAASGGGPGQVSNCAQATNVSIAITPLCANFAPANPRRAPGSEPAMSYTGRSPGSQFTIRIHRMPSRSYVPTPYSNLPGPPSRRLHAAALPGACCCRSAATRSAKWRSPRGSGLRASPPARTPCPLCLPS